MLPFLKHLPELRCQARSRASGWQQCGRVACTGMKVCWTHGGAAARKKPRFGTDAPNYKHGGFSVAAKKADSKKLAELRELENLMHWLNMTTAKRMPGRKPKN